MQLISVATREELLLSELDNVLISECSLSAVRQTSVLVREDWLPSEPDRRVLVIPEISPMTRPSSKLTREEDPPRELPADTCLLSREPRLMLTSAKPAGLELVLYVDRNILS